MKTEYKVDGLDELEKALTKMIENKYPEEFEKVVLQLAYELQGSCKELTPQRTGRLKDGWRVGKVLKNEGGVYVEVYNNVEYAEHVNYGHRTGQSGFKDGVFMLEISMEKIERRLPLYLKAWINKFIKEHGL